MLSNKKTMIEVYKTTHKRLVKARVTKREEFDEVINRLLNLLEEKTKSYSQKVNKLKEGLDKDGNNFYSGKRTA